jgi:hypothetical protein
VKCNDIKICDLYPFPHYAARIANACCAIEHIDLVVIDSISANNANDITYHTITR